MAMYCRCLRSTAVANACQSTIKGTMGVMLLWQKLTVHAVAAQTLIVPSMVLSVSR